MKYRKIINSLILAGLVVSTKSLLANEIGKSQSKEVANSSIQIADAYEIVPANATEQEQQVKISDRLKEIELEQRAAKRAANGYYVERKSYGTGRETEPPRYVKQLNKTWLKDYDAFSDIDWLDIGLDYRIRYEKRDNDFRRGRDTIDDPILLRTRAYVAVKTF